MTLKNHVSGGHSKMVSTYTIFGQSSPLHRINDKLYEHGIHTYGDLSTITEKQFWNIIDRTTPSNVERIKEIFILYPPDFKKMQPCKKSNY